MALYRALHNLSKNEKTIPAGTILAFQWLNETQIGKLIAVGAIAPVGAPPLVALPGWKTRATKCGKLGLETAEQFLEADTAHLADVLHLKPETVERWKVEVLGWLTVPETYRG